MADTKGENTQSVIIENSDGKTEQNVDGAHGTDKTVEQNVEKYGGDDKPTRESTLTEKGQLYQIGQEHKLSKRLMSKWHRDSEKIDILL